MTFTHTVFCFPCHGSLRTTALSACWHTCVLPAQYHWRRSCRHRRRMRAERRPHYDEWHFTVDVPKWEVLTAVSIRLTLSVNSFSLFLYHRHHWRKEVSLSKIQLVKGTVNKFVNKHIVENCYKNSDPQVYFYKCLVNRFETLQVSDRHDKCKWSKMYDALLTNKERKLN